MHHCTEAIVSIATPARAARIKLLFETSNYEKARALLSKRNWWRAESVKSVLADPEGVVAAAAAPDGYLMSLEPSGWIERTVEEASVLFTDGYFALLVSPAGTMLFAAEGTERHMSISPQ